MGSHELTLDYGNFDSLWAAFHWDDRAATGRLFMAVRTTGIFCRPGCPARQPKPGNVRFFATASAAQRAGFRACKRCRPGDVTPDPKLALVEAACRYIDENFAENVKLDALANALNVSGQTLQRAFRDVIGLSPRAWARERRLSELRSELRSGADVTGAIYGAGFGSASRVYESAASDLGMTPSRYGKGGEAHTVSVAVGTTPFGVIGVGKTDTGICSVRLGDSEAAVIQAIQAELPKAASSVPAIQRIWTGLWIMSFAARRSPTFRLIFRAPPSSERSGASCARSRGVNVARTSRSRTALVRRRLCGRLRTLAAPIPRHWLCLATGSSGAMAEPEAIVGDRSEKRRYCVWNRVPRSVRRNRVRNTDRARFLRFAATSRHANLPRNH